MQKSKVSIFLILLVFLFLSGCARTEKETAMVLETGTVAEQDNTVVEPITTEVEENTELEVESVTAAETETEKASEIEDTTETVAEMETISVEMEKMEYEVTQMEEVSMYATNAVNVRKGPSTDFERVGALKRGQEVRVTGEASTGWYEITYGEERAFVSHKYLQMEPVPVQQPQETASSSAGVSATTNIILIGDSRTAEMKSCVGENSCIWIAEHSRGIKWFVSDAVPAADPYIMPGTKVIINLGANDPEKIDTYIYTINEVAANWTARGATVYYATVGPCYQNPYHTNDEAVNFNAALQNGLVGVHWIDLYSHMVNNGFATRENDGFHYDAPTYAGIYSYYMSCIR